MAERGQYFEREKRKLRRSTGAQIRFLVDYMANHRNLATGDFPPGPFGMKRAEDEWLKLKNILKGYGPDKKIEQWKNSWRDLKKKARDEIKRIKQATQESVNGAEVPELSSQSRTILEAIGCNSDGDETGFGDAGPDDSADTSVDTPWSDSRLRKPTQNGDTSELTPNVPEDGVRRKVKEDPLDYEKEEEIIVQPGFTYPHYHENSQTKKSSRRRKTSVSSGSSSSRRPYKKAKKTDSRKDKDIIGTLNKFIEYEREKEQLAHEREMIRISQNDKVLNLLGKTVEVLEALAPSIKKYIDRNVSEDK